MVTNCCLLFQLLPARLGELLDCDLQNILRFVIISSQSRAVVRQNRTCDIGLTLISEPVTYQWGGQAGPECTSPRGPGKNVLSTAQNLLVITIHNYLRCTSVLCTSVKLSADLNCTETADIDNSKKGKASPYSTAERTVPELIPVLGSQHAGGLPIKGGEMRGPSHPQYSC